jgi:hypothetical protein
LLYCTLYGQGENTEIGASEKDSYNINYNSNIKNFEIKYCGPGIKICDVPFTDPSIDATKLCQEGYFANLSDGKLDPILPCKPCTNPC